LSIMNGPDVVARHRRQALCWYPWLYLRISTADQRRVKTGARSDNGRNHDPIGPSGQWWIEAKALARGASSSLPIP